MGTHHNVHFAPFVFMLLCSRYLPYFPKSAPIIGSIQRCKWPLTKLTEPNFWILGQTSPADRADYPHFRTYWFPSLSISCVYFDESYYIHHHKLISGSNGKHLLRLFASYTRESLKYETNRDQLSFSKVLDSISYNWVNGIFNCTSKCNTFLPLSW